MRTRLGGFGFGQDKALVPVGELSGGERARLNLALVTHDAPSLLILDEPTNHLDMETREALVEALAEYSGAVVLVSHDWHLVELVADRLWLVDDGTVRPFDGDLEAYRRRLLDARAGAGAERNGARAGAGDPRRVGAPRGRRAPGRARAAAPQGRARAEADGAAARRRAAGARPPAGRRRAHSAERRRRSPRPEAARRAGAADRRGRGRMARRRGGEIERRRWQAEAQRFAESAANAHRIRAAKGRSAAAAPFDSRAGASLCQY